MIAIRSDRMAKLGSFQTGHEVLPEGRAWGLRGSIAKAPYRITLGHEQLLLMIAIVLNGRSKV